MRKQLTILLIFVFAIGTLVVFQHGVRLSELAIIQQAKPSTA